MVTTIIKHIMDLVLGLYGWTVYAVVVMKQELKNVHLMDGELPVPTVAIIMTFQLNVVSRKHVQINTQQQTLHFL